jgi:hypothetical protein
MKRRGWGFSWMSRMIVIGPIQNPDWEATAELPLIEAIATGVDPVETLKRAIERVENKNEPG